MSAKLSRPIAFVAAVILGVLSLYCSDTGFSRLQQFQQLKRTPIIPVAAVLSGENLLQGEVVAGGNLLKAPHSGKPSVYYRYTKKHRCKKDKRDSWCEVENKSNYTDFVLRDASGTIKVMPNANVRWKTPRVEHERIGEYLHSEWRIEPGQAVTILGYAEEQETNYQISFSGEHQLFPTITNQSAEGIFEKTNNQALLYCWGGVALAAAATLALMVALQFHRLIGFVSLLTLVVSGQLFVGSVNTVKLSKNNAQSQMQSLQMDAQNYLKRIFRKQGVQWDGWQHLDSLQQNVARLSDHDKAAVERKLQNLQLRLHHLQQNNQIIPGYSLFSATPPTHRSLFQALEQLNPLVPNKKLPPAEKTSSKSKWILLVIATIMALVTSITGISKVRVKRIMENIPTSKAAGLTMGLSEIKGTISTGSETAPKTDQTTDSAPLTTPYFHKPCVWYRHRIQENNSDRKGQDWETIADETHQRAFRVVDDTASISVNLEGAQVITSHKQSTREGRRRHKVEWLEEGDQCYLIGNCALPFVDSGKEPLSLELSKPEDGRPFIISNSSESTLLFNMAFSGMLLITLGMSLSLGAMLMWFNLTTEVTLAHLFLLGILPPLLFLIITIVLHYNDIVFLKQRVNRNRANISVALQKRFDNINHLIPVLQKYLDHESKLLNQLTALRTENQTSQQSSTHLPHYLKQEHGFLLELSATLERYPDLKSHQVIHAFNQRLIALETELAFIKDAYNNAVEVFNTRIQSFPDNILNLILKYETETFLRLK